MSFKSPATTSEAMTPNGEQKDITATKNAMLMVARLLLREIVFIKDPSLFKTRLIKKLHPKF
jgi:hypothetical protein